MIRADQAINRLRRDLTLSSALNFVLLGGAVMALMVEGVAASRVPSGAAILAVIAAIWMALVFHSIRGSRLAADSAMLIAAGQFERAEANLAEVLRSFSLFRGIKLRAIHHLAMLRHAQRRWSEAAQLCDALLAQRLGPVGSLSRSTRLILADSLLEVGDVASAYHALAGLYQQRLTLGEATELLTLQTEYLARIGAWGEMLRGLGRKIELAELLPAAKSARTQALLALAAARSGRGDWQRYLQRRAELLAEPSELVAQRPMLSELWPTARPALEAAGSPGENEGNEGN